MDFERRMSGNSVQISEGEISLIRAIRMGQYYRFINATRETESNIPLPFNFGLPWAKNLENASREELHRIFDYVVKSNNWAETDEILATGDYGSIVYRPKET
jgi:hypothetical protein